MKRSLSRADTGMARSTRQKWILMVVLACSIALAPDASAQQSDSMHWSITPYLWAPTTTIDLGVRGTSIASGEITFDDLLNALDAAFMIHIEGGKGNWTGFADMTYLDTSHSNQRQVLNIKTDSQQSFLDFAAVYWPAGVGTQFNVFGGVRYTGFEDEFRFYGPAGNLLERIKSTEDYYDALIGARYRFDLSERWKLMTHADFSFGESEGTFLLRANFAYIVGKRRQNRILLGYQYKEANFKDGDLEKDFVYHGPMAGFNFRF
jgi:hypothetical protein